MSLLFSFDQGANSIGWAVIDKEKNALIDSGVRIFEGGVENLGTRKETSKNVKRREARQRRKQLRRKKFRLNKIKDFFISQFELNENNIKFKISDESPYILRAKALDNKLNIPDIFKTCYHIAKHRGYKNPRSIFSPENETEGTIEKGDEKSGKVGVNVIKEALEGGKFRSIGEYLNSLDPHNQRRRNRYTLREHYEIEFDLIMSKQQEFYKNILTDKIIKQLRAIIFFQRPLKSQKHTLGHCPFEKNKSRIPMSHPIYQEFRMLQQVNNLKLKINQRIDSDYQLTQSEQEFLLAHLEINSSLSLSKSNSKLKKIIGINHKGNMPTNFDHQKKLNGCDTLTKLKKCLGDEYIRLSYESNTDDFLKLYHFIYSANRDNKEKFLNKIKDKFELSDKIAENLFAVKLETGYGNLSNKAIKNIIPYMRQGQRYDQACESFGQLCTENGNNAKAIAYRHNLYEETKILDTLPKFKENGVSNPVVIIAMTELRKVTNALIKRYGLPDKINIEVARNMKMSSKQRVDEISKIDKNRTQNEEDTKEIISFNVFSENATPKKNDLIKLRLWKECNQICPYTGKSISKSDLFNGEFEIEHIIPLSKSLDDSYMNKTLCHKDANHKKSNRTPFETWAGSNEWNNILLRAKELPKSKFDRFKTTSTEEWFDAKGNGDFINSQLNDTAYITKISLRFLKNICKEIVPVRGNMTAMLRNHWKLNDILWQTHSDSLLEEMPKGEKLRLDHRHHAIDAIVIGMMDRALLQNLSSYTSVNGSMSLKYKHDRFELPWVGFKEAVEKSISNIIISHKVKQKPTGQLHEETFYGLSKDRFGNPILDHKSKKLYRVRKNLNTLTEKMIGQIADPKVKELVQERVASFGEIPYKSNIIFEKPIEYIDKKGKTQIIKKVRLLLPFSNSTQIADYNKHVQTGNNFMVIIYQDLEKNKQDAKVLTLYEASKIGKMNREGVNQFLGPNKELINTLKMNELVLWSDLPEGFDFNDKSLYRMLTKSIYRYQKASSDNTITLRNHLVSQVQISTSKNNKDQSYGRNFVIAHNFKLLKLKIDNIGFLSIADD